jgi:hypothetical protein
MSPQLRSSADKAKKSIQKQKIKTKVTSKHNVTSHLALLVLKYN